MLENLKFIVIEDKNDDRLEVLTKLSDAGLQAKNKVGEAATYEEALELLSRNAGELDVAFLDLNLPRDADDVRPEKQHGANILRFIHEDINRRPMHLIHVVVVSGEDLLDGVSDDALYERYRGTLVSIAHKAALPRTLRASIKRLKRDPLRSALERFGLPLVDDYDAVVAPSSSNVERLKAARRIAIHLVRNECDHYLAGTGTTSAYADDLAGLIKDHINVRFNSGYVKHWQINTTSGWGGFLWRGPFVQHLYFLNNYRNIFEHIVEQPLQCPAGEADTWSVPDHVLIDIQKGGVVLDVVPGIVKDLLSWYLPWHEQVYIPWKESTT